MELSRSVFNKNKNRIWELDFLRGVALILMVYFHVIFDMKDMYSYNVVYDSGINYFIGKTSAILFMFLAGISCTLSRSNIKRGLKVLGIAMVITLATHLYSPSLGIKFGILHFLSVGMLLSPLLMKLNRFVLIALGAAFVAAGPLVAGISVNHDWLFVFGIYSSKFASSDYYPLIPWFSVFLFGLAAGRFLYKRKASLFKTGIGPNPVSSVGKYTLTVYLLHQPLIIAVLELIKMLK